jgi:hypothetical protein
MHGVTLQKSDYLELYKVHTLYSVEWYCEWEW